MVTRCGRSWQTNRSSRFPVPSSQFSENPRTHSVSTENWELGTANFFEGCDQRSAIVAGGVRRGSVGGYTRFNTRNKREIAAIFCLISVVDSRTKVRPIYRSCL